MGPGECAAEGRAEGLAPEACGPQLARGNAPLEWAHSSAQVRRHSWARAKPGQGFVCAPKTNSAGGGRRTGGRPAGRADTRTRARHRPRPGHRARAGAATWRAWPPLTCWWRPAARRPAVGHCWPRARQRHYTNSFRVPNQFGRPGGAATMARAGANNIGNKLTSFTGILIMRPLHRSLSSLGRAPQAAAGRGSVSRRLPVALHTTPICAGCAPVSHAAAGRPRSLACARQRAARAPQRLGEPSHSLARARLEPW